MIVDFHARVAPGGGDALLAAMDRFGIGRAVISAGGVIALRTLSRHLDDGGRAEARADNAYVAEWARKSGGRLAPVFFADPIREAATYRAAADRYRGVEISPAVHGFRLSDPAVADVVAAARGFVYLVTTAQDGARPADLAVLAARFPRTPFVWGHCGHHGLDLTGIDTLGAIPNVHAEISGCLTITARIALVRFGAARVLFGTEFPLQSPGVELAKLAALDLDHHDTYAVTCGNARRLLGEDT